MTSEPQKVFFIPRLCSESNMASVMRGPICVTFSANTAMRVYRGTLPGNSFWNSFISDSAGCWRVFSWFCDLGLAYSWTQTSIGIENSIWGWGINIYTGKTYSRGVCNLTPFFLPQLMFQSLFFSGPSRFPFFTHHLPSVNYILLCTTISNWHSSSLISIIFLTLIT